MKNLQLLELEHKKLVDDLISRAEIFDTTNECTYFISKSLYKHDFKLNTITEVCPQVFVDPLCIKFLSVENKICIVTRTQLHIFNPDSELQSVHFDENVAAISWSPTEETIVIVSETNNVITCYVDYQNAELFVETQTNVNVQIPDTVYVGWGSHETQFRGSAGKFKPETPVEVEPVIDKKPTISWRGNGEMFVVNYWTQDNRTFVVFETNGKAIYRSESTPGLQPQIAWRPTGNMIASLCFSTKGQSVVIFEKNGQKRFSFDLNLSQMTVKQIVWSPCATILTILSETRNGEEQNINLFTSSNYIWYEKQRLTFQRSNRLLNFDWLTSSQFTFTLRVVTKIEIANYTFISTTNVSSSICAVVNGSKLQITDFKTAIIPPPMCSYTFTNSHCINFVTFCEDLLAIVDSNNCVTIFHANNPNICIYSQKLDELITDVALIALSFHHFILDHDFLVFAAETSTETLVFHLNYKTNVFNSVATISGRLRQFIRGDDAFGFTRVFQNFYINECPNYIIQEISKNYTCRLTWTCDFYINAQKLSDCTNSFLVFGDYLLYTTKKNQLFCARLDDITSDAIYCRNVEQGSVLIAAIPDTSTIVFQLPRGNLETISCRLISIDILNALLEKNEWKRALRFVRLEKLNANLLFDLNPARFLTEIRAFVNAASTCNELNAFVMEFEPANVLKTMYKNWGDCDDKPNKIETIFGAFFKYLNSVDYLPFVTTAVIVNVNFFTIREALIYVQDLYRRASNDALLVNKLNETINTFKIYGCDQERLYTETLLLYDLNLARFVAGRCQMDPRVFEPQIDALKTKPEVERRFDINVYAKKYDKAVAYMLRVEKFTSDEIRAFIKTHAVGKQAYAACPRLNRHFKVVSRAFADGLPVREAARVLKRADLLEEAFERCVVGLLWRDALSLADELKIDDERRVGVAVDMARALVQRHVIQEAAILYEYYARDDKMAVKVLADNYLFEDAIHVAKRHGRVDDLKEIIQGLLRYKNDLKKRLDELYKTYNKHKSRLGVVRKTKLSRIRGGELDEQDDLFSEVGSTITRSSRASRSSTASSRNRRKEERKKQDLREGGIYEDIALIRALYSTIKEIYDKGEDVCVCCTLLLQETDTKYKELREFYKFYSKIENEVKNDVGEIWPPHFYSYKQTNDAQELVDLENFEHLDLEFRVPPKYEAKCKLSLF